MKKQLFAVAAISLLGLIGAGVGAKGLEPIATMAGSASVRIINLDLGTSYNLWINKTEPAINVKYESVSQGSAQKAMTPQLGYYSAEIPDDATNIRFNVNGWTNDCETEELSLPSSASQNLFVITGDKGGGNRTGAWSTLTMTTRYILDLKGNHAPTKAHIWDTTKSKTNESYDGTSWPGIDLEKDAGADHIYKVSFYNRFNKVIFNSGSSPFQTDDLSIADGECFVLENKDGWAGRFITYNAAAFIDNYLKFSTIWIDNTTSGTACLAGFADIKAAYNTLTDEDRSSVLSVENAKNRLLSWAEANGETLPLTGDAIPDKARIVTSGDMLSQDNSIIISSIVISAAALFGLGTLLAIKRRRSE